MIKKLAVALAAATVFTVGAAGIASATLDGVDVDDGSPAAVKAQCEAAGGEHVPAASSTDVRCIVETGGTAFETVVGSHPKQVWHVDLQIVTESTTVFRVARDPADSRNRIWVVEEVIGGGDPIVTVVGCRNHQGKTIGGFASNPHCQPA